MVLRTCEGPEECAFRGSKDQEGNPTEEEEVRGKAVFAPCDGVDLGFGAGAVGQRGGLPGIQLTRIRSTALPVVPPSLPGISPELLLSELGHLGM